MRVLGLFGQRDQVGAVEVYRITLPFTYLNNESETRCGWMTVTDAAAHLRAEDTDTVFGKDIVVLIADATGAYRETTVAELLPDSFSAADLD